MRRNCSRILCVLLMLVAVISLLPNAAYAESLSYSGKVDEYTTFWFHTNYDKEVQSASIDNGGVPGMSLSYPNPASVSLAGTPTAAGSYTLYVSVYTMDGDWLQYTLNITISPAPTQPPASDGIPVITKHPGGETVTETDSAVFTAYADHTSQYKWELLTADGKTVMGENLEATFPGLKASGYGVDRLVLENIPLSLNGCKVRCCFVGTAQSVYSNYATITVKAAKDATPVVTKNPTSERVDEGGLCQFVARAKYAQKYQWELVSPRGTVYDAATADKAFPGLKVTGAASETLTLKNIPYELDGFTVRCKFTAGTTVTSESAYIYVNPSKETNAATTEATTEPATEPATEPVTEAPATEPVETTQPPATEEPTIADEPAFGDEAPEESGGNNTVLLVTIICGAVVAVAAIAAFVILKLKKR